METLQALADWMTTLPPLWVYVFVFVVAYGENVVPPIPGDMAIVFGGSLVALGTVAFVPTLLLSVAGGTLGFLTMFAMGRWLGEAVHDPARLRWIPRGPVRSVDIWFARYGLAVVAVNRFLTGARSVIALVAGASGMPLVPTALAAALSALVWSALLVGGGFVVGAEWDRMLGLLNVYGRVMGVALGMVAAVALGAWLWKRRRQETEKTPRADRRTPGAR